MQFTWENLSKTLNYRFVIYIYQDNAVHISFSKRTHSFLGSSSASLATPWASPLHIAIIYLHSERDHSSPRQVLLTSKISALRSRTITILSLAELLNVSLAVWISLFLSISLAAHFLWGFLPGPQLIEDVNFILGDRAFDSKVFWPTGSWAQFMSIHVS